MKDFNHSYTGLFISVALAWVSFFLSAYLCNSKYRSLCAYLVLGGVGYFLIDYLGLWGVPICVFFVIYMLTDKTDKDK